MDKDTDAVVIENSEASYDVSPQIELSLTDLDMVGGGAVGLVFL